MMKTRGLVIWLILMVLIYWAVFNLDTSSNLNTGSNLNTDFNANLNTNFNLGNKITGLAGFWEACTSSADCTNASAPVCMDISGAKVCTECDGDSACSAINASKPYCMLREGSCVECKETSNCGAGKICLNNVCVQEQRITAYWNFDSSNLNDAVSGNNGAAQGTSLSFTEGVKSKGLSFDTASYMEVSSSESLNPAEAITISAWIKPVFSDDGKDKSIADKRAISGSGYNLRHVNKKVQFALRDNSGNEAVAETADNALKDDWNFVAGTYDKKGNTIIIYVNGEKAKEQILSSAISTIGSSEKLKIGASALSSDAGYRFKGIIDEIKIYNYALTNISSEYGSNKLVFKGKVLGSLSTYGLITYVDGASTAGKEYTTSKPVALNKSGQAMVEFNFDFSKYNLNVSNISFSEQPSSSIYGYTIVAGLNAYGEKKTVYVKDIHKNNYTCIKDMEVASISEVSRKCNDEKEYLIDCGNNQSANGYKCTDLGAYYKVEGLSNSAVREMNCTEYWVCGSWGKCANKKQARTCNETAGCGTSFTKPFVEQSCTMLPASTTTSNTTDDFTDYGQPNADENDTSYLGESTGDNAGAGAIEQTTGEIEGKKTEIPKSNMIDFKIVILGAVILIWLAIMVWLLFLRKHKGLEGVNAGGIFKESYAENKPMYSLGVGAGKTEEIPSPSEIQTKMPEAVQKQIIPAVQKPIMLSVQKPIIPAVQKIVQPVQIPMQKPVQPVQIQKQQIQIPQIQNAQQAQGVQSVQQVQKPEQAVQKKEEKQEQKKEEKKKNNELPW